MAVREYTVKLANAIQDGMMDRDPVITAAARWVSQQEVKNLCESNGFVSDPVITAAARWVSQQEVKNLCESNGFFDSDC